MTLTRESLSVDDIHCIWFDMSNTYALNKVETRFGYRQCEIKIDMISYYQVDKKVYETRVTVIEDGNGLRFSDYYGRWLGYCPLNVSQFGHLSGIISNCVELLISNASMIKL